MCLLNDIKVIHIKLSGDVDILRLVDLARPRREPGDTIIAVEASGVK